MAIQNRNTTLPGIWAENAQTTIPTPPVAGVTYRDTTLNSTAIDKAWPFKTIVDSSDFNQHAFLQDTLIKEAEQYGVMRWNNTTTYKEGGYCLGQDKKLYQAKRDNQGKEPTASKDDWFDVLSIYQLIANLSQTVDGSTSKYPSNKAVLDYTESKAVPVGAFMPYAADTPPEGWLKCDGSTVSRTTYSALFAKIGTKYGSGDGSKTFNLPNFINKTFWGDSSSGTVKAAGLPSIQHTHRHRHGLPGANSSCAGGGRVLYVYGANDSGSAAQGYRQSEYDNTQNSAVSAIYGKSSTVQPPALTTIICIKY